MKELIKAEEEKTLFIGRHGNECIYVVRAVSREAAMLVECRSLLLERINWCMTAILES